MNIVIIGLGSMGKRRARLIKAIDEKINVYGVDTSISRCEEAEKLGIKTFNSINNAVQNIKIDASFVCTSPLSHNKIISELLDNNISVFSEINLVSDGYSENIAKAKDKNLTLFMSNTMLYRNEIKYIKKSIQDFNAPVNYVYHVGQYLPDWHPWESYKDFFVGDKRTNGCRELFGIEFPWLFDIFGIAEIIAVEKRNISKLEINFPDSYYLLLKHKDGTLGTIVADVVSPKAVRNFECFGDGLHLFWEGNPKALYKYNNETKEKEYINTYESFEQLKQYSDNVVETAFAEEIINYFNVLNKTQEPKHTFEKDLICINLMDKIEG